MLGHFSFAILKCMKEKVLAFVKYNNIFAIAFMAVFFGFGISFAASPTVRESVYSSEETIIAVNNKLILTTNLDDFNFNLKINSVTEDEKNYYALYSYQTLAVLDGVWQTKGVEKTLTVSKEALGDKDLGLYLAKELGDNINYELSYLKRAQQLEKDRGESAKVVAVEYDGLIGKFLDPKELVIEGYDPVVETAAAEQASEVELHPEADYDESIKTPVEEPEESEEPEEPVVPEETTGEVTATSTEGVDNSATEPEPEPEPAPEIKPEGVVEEGAVSETETETVVEEPATEPEVAPAPTE